jgi:hypothetical protein
MGLLTKLATLPVAPVWGVAWVARKVAEYAEEEMYGEAGVRRQLLEIDAAHAAGEISDEERDRLERAALAALAEHQGLEGVPWSESSPDAREVEGHGEG